VTPQTADPVKRYNDADADSLGFAELLTSGCCAQAQEPALALRCLQENSCPPPQDGICERPSLDGRSGEREVYPFSPAYDKPCISRSKSSAVRDGDTLRLMFRNGTMRAYKNNWSEKACEQDPGPHEHCRFYVLYDYFPAYELFLVHVEYYESDEWLLVRRLNGKQEKVVAPPRYSPNKKWLASVYWTEGTDDGNNGIDIVSTNPAQRSFHYRPREYELWEFVRWDGDDRLVLTVTWQGAAIRSRSPGLRKSCA
jgi:hypothetical protein